MSIQSVSEKFVRCPRAVKIPFWLISMGLKVKEMILPPFKHFIMLFLLLSLDHLTIILNTLRSTKKWITASSFLENLSSASNNLNSILVYFSSLRVLGRSSKTLQLSLVPELSSVSPTGVIRKIYHQPNFLPDSHLVDRYRINFLLLTKLKFQKLLNLGLIRPSTCWDSMPLRRSMRGILLLLMRNSPNILRECSRTSDWNRYPTLELSWQ